MRLTVAQAYNYARLAGFDGTALDIMVAIAQAESGLDTLATNTTGNTPPSRDRGILQINSYWHPEVSDQCAYSPACAFAAGYTIAQRGADFNPWTTYKTGAYQRYLTIDPHLVNWTTRLLNGPIPALNEFGGGFHDACGPAAQVNLIAAIRGVAPDSAAIIAVRAYALAMGHFTVGSGETIHGVMQDLTGYWHWPVGELTLYDYLPNFAPYSRPALQSALASILVDEAGGVIIEVNAAHTLPNNEQGVNTHFISALAYHSGPDVPMVIIANGDALPLPNGPGMAYAISLDQLQAAEPIAAIAVRSAPRLVTTYPGSVTPPTPPTPPPAPPQPPTPTLPTSYTVRKGDTLSAIAQHFYTDGAQWPLIYHANQSVIGGNPNLIYPGQILIIPARTPTPPIPTRFYIVIAGDSLWSIARHFYGDGAQWGRIYQANTATIGSNPNVIRPGERLVIP